MVSFCIIVARYNENLEWTKPFSNVIVYNKGEKMEDEYNEIFLDNVGREGHTYYTYICENYDNLSDYTIFLQGYPFNTKCENNECIFGAGAQFIVAKNKILQHPKEFYENIVKILGYSICPFEGYDIERFHKYIFM